MDFDHLFAIAETAKTGRTLAADDVGFLQDDVPAALSDYPQIETPKSIRHPAGFAVSGAPVGTFVRSALMLAGRRAFGHRFGGEAFYERAETDLAMRIMRANFHGDTPKGAFCCQQCTLAVLPVLESGAIRWFDGPALGKDVRALIAAGRWRFATAPNARMLAWATS